MADSRSSTSGSKVSFSSSLNEVLNKIRSSRIQKYVSRTSLLLSGQEVSDDMLSEVMTCLNDHPDISTLDLSANRIGLNGAFFVMQNNKTATTVNLAGNNIGMIPCTAKDLEKLALANTVAKTLILSANNIDAEKAGGFLMYNRVATTLDLSVNRLGPKGALFVAQNNRTATKISLRYCNLGPEGARNLARYSTVANQLDLRCNKIGPKASLEFLAETSATEVCLAENGLGDAEINSFLRMGKRIILTVLPTELSPETWQKLEEHNNAIRTRQALPQASEEPDENRSDFQNRLGNSNGNQAGFWNRIRKGLDLRATLPSHQALSKLNKPGFNRNR